MRHPSGPEFIDKLVGSERAKLRARVLLETIADACRVIDACERLGIKEARFDQIRLEGMQALVDAMEERPAGRKPRRTSPAEIENEQLRSRIAELEAQVRAALVKVELAVALPNAGEPELKKTDATRSGKRS